jgi:hypothetical protein
MKKTLFTSALLFAALCTAGTKQYTVTFVNSVQVGSVTLPAGEYKVKVDGTNAIFTDRHKKTFTTPAKIEKVEKKSPFTAAETKEVHGTQELNAIDLDGADFKLVF